MKGIMDHTSEITALTQQLTMDNLALWSDEKRKSFVETFEARIKAARYILLKTAEFVARTAKTRHFISDKHMRGGIPKDGDWITTGVLDTSPGNHWDTIYKAGGRPCSELDQIAKERAQAIVDTLPKLADAVRIISPEIGKLIEKRDRLLDKGKDLMAKSEELSANLNMVDLDQDMTIGEFREMVKQREKERLALIHKLDEIGIEGREYDNRINKFLYEGLPGMSDAVVKVIKDYLERSTAFTTLNRRVAEQIQFGDSEAALEMLKTFEKDEISISTDIKAQFDAALDALKLAAKKKLPTKQVKRLKG